MKSESNSISEDRSGTAAALPLGRAPELLAPAGDWDCARAAVENGADGIYFGLDRFNARMRAQNFTVADLPKLMAFLHRRGVKGYVTFNTLVFAEELTEAAGFLRDIIAAGVDAAIVQDIGVARLIRALSPDFPFHASTQMTVTSAAGMVFARSIGCERVILARECSLAEIGKIRESARAAELPQFEVFVHGALCVAYSGQCLTSESLGGRSANRGECAQACRMPFELVSDGQVVPLGDRRYLLSPQDLAGLELLPEMVRLGVASVKIEGRLKAPEYVANITRIYRQALDRVVRELQHPNPGVAPAGKTDRSGPLSHDFYDMEMAFSRGLFTGWYRGVDNQRLVHGRFGKKRGVYLGQVSRVQGERVFLRLENAVKPGDGIVLDAGRPDQDEEGGRVYEVRSLGARGGSANPRSGPGAAGETALAFGRGDIDFGRVHVGDRVWKTSDPEMDRRIRKTYEGDVPRFQRGIDLEVSGTAGQPMRLRADDGVGHSAQIESALPLAVANNRPLTVDSLRDQLGRLGGTPFVLRDLRSSLVGPVILPMSELNRLRRELVSKLDEARTRPLAWTLRAQEEVQESWAPLLNLAKPSDRAAAPDHEAELVVLVRDMAQFEAVLGLGLGTVYCEFEDPRKYREAVERFRKAPPGPTGGDRERAIFAAPPRITKMGEDWILPQVTSCQADGFLVRNYDHLAAFAGARRVGDFTLNVANPLAAEYFIRQCGLERVTVSYDLNAEQVAGLLKSAPPHWFEITIHQHMPMFHMEHCLFCAFLSQGKDYRDCGRPCDKHRVHLLDRVGAAHPVKADAGCRNTVFNAIAQTGAESVPRYLALGARRFRLEFLDETAERVVQTVRMYRGLLRGEVTGAQVWRELKLINRLGVTRGPRERAESQVPKFGEIEW